MKSSVCMFLSWSHSVFLTPGIEELRTGTFWETLKEKSRLDPGSLDIAQFCFSEMWLTWVSQARDKDS